MIIAMVGFTTFSWAAFHTVRSDSEAEATILYTADRVECAWISSPQPVDTQAEAFLWLCRNPGQDAEGLAGHLNISPVEASDTIEGLLNEGLLDFAD